MMHRLFWSSPGVVRLAPRPRCASHHLDVPDLRHSTHQADTVKPYDQDQELVATPVADDAGQETRPFLPGNFYIDRDPTPPWGIRRPLRLIESPLP